MLQKGCVREWGSVGVDVSVREGEKRKEDEGEEGRVKKNKKRGKRQGDK
jgi:hypothetical protein